ncbi:dipeptide epimerase [Micromonospora echinofusca]|uniref:Dipeptide epimerase n=1 Tax=Micromonospora echinofusca TaxID=47858 RepID=A0ABS3VPH3_MICEH|nr:dipeptide epimerase [Micromonospora echinofusca]MBO4206396.1 dipeptide epimerase [Micromonospora echinofusca]
MELTWRVYPLVLREPLRISRSAMAGRDAVQVTVRHDGTDGHGELVTSTYLRLDLATAVSALAGLADRIAGCPDPETLHAGLPTLTGQAPPGVRAALDAAVHDLLGRRAGVPVHRLLGLTDGTPVGTAYTIGLVPPDAAATAARRLVTAGFTTVKVKAGDADDVARVAAVRAAAPQARLLLDPNGGWTAEQTVRLLDAMAAHRIDAVEQPVPPGDPDRLAWIGARTPVPVVADEDAVSVTDVHRLAGAVAGVNVKLARCGGITAAREIIDVATGYGLDVMLGCLVASSLGIAPAVHLTATARWVDLDGHLLLADDPWTGLGGHDGTLRLTGTPGLGVTAVEQPTVVSR